LIDPESDYERKLDILGNFLRKINKDALNNISPIKSDRRHIRFLSDWLNNQGLDTSSIEETLHGVLTIRNYHQHRGEPNDDSEEKYFETIVPKWFEGNDSLPEKEKWQIVISKISIALSELLEELRKLVPFTQ
jgi:hypothetical protein